MRILHVVNELDNFGDGIVNVTVDLACTQADLGHEVSVVSSGGAFEPLLAAHGVTHHRARFTRTPRVLRSAFRVLGEVVTAEHPSVVHAHTMTPVVLLRVLRAAGRWRGSSRRAFLLVTTVHNEYQRGVVLMGLADVTVAVSQAVAAEMRKRGVPAGKVRVVLNGTLGTPRRRPVAEIAPLPLGGRAIVALGAVSERKGADVLLEAFAQLAPDRPDLHLWYVGNVDWPDIPLRAGRLASAERIHFPGLEREPARYLKSATAFVLASRRDPFPLVLAEAREVGAAIVASAVDGVPEALDEGRAGVLVPVDDPAELAHQLAAVLDDPARVRELTARSRTGVERYSVQRMARDYLAVYSARRSP